jgi:hypothetical protein
VLDKNLVEFLYQDKEYRTTINTILQSALNGHDTANFELVLFRKVTQAMNPVATEAHSGLFAAVLRCVARRMGRAWM